MDNSGTTVERIFFRQILDIMILPLIFACIFCMLADAQRNVLTLSVSTYRTAHRQPILKPGAVFSLDLAIQGDFINLSKERLTLTFGRYYSSTDESIVRKSVQVDASVFNTFVVDSRREQGIRLLAKVPEGLFGPYILHLVIQRGAFKNKDRLLMVCVDRGSAVLDKPLVLLTNKGVRRIIGREVSVEMGQPLWYSTENSNTLVAFIKSTELPLVAHKWDCPTRCNKLLLDADELAQVLLPNGDITFFHPTCYSSWHDGKGKRLPRVLDTISTRLPKSLELDSTHGLTQVLE